VFRRLDEKWLRLFFDCGRRRTVEIRELGGVRFTQNDRACNRQLRDDLGINQCLARTAPALSWLNPQTPSDLPRFLV